MATRANIKASISIDKNYISLFLARTTLVNVHYLDPSVRNKVILRRGLWRIQLRAEFGWKTFKVTSEWILRPIFFLGMKRSSRKKTFQRKKIIPCFWKKMATTHFCKSYKMLPIASSLKFLGKFWVEKRNRGAAARTGTTSKATAVK